MENPSGRRVLWGFQLVLHGWCSHSGDDHFGADIETGTGVIEGVDGGFRLKMKIAPPVHPFQQVPEKSGNIIDIRLRIILWR